MNNTEEKISILKMDIEGEEFRTLPNLIESNILENILQLNVEAHDTLSYHAVQKSFKIKRISN